LSVPEVADEAGSGKEIRRHWVRLVEEMWLNYGKRGRVLDERRLAGVKDVGEGLGWCDGRSSATGDSGGHPRPRARKLRLGAVEIYRNGFVDVASYPTLCDLTHILVGGQKIWVITQKVRWGTSYR
jgi:hypothetical protein